MPTLKQYGVLAVGLFTSMGFFLGGISSFSGMVDTQPAQGPDDMNIELPDSNFNSDGFQRSPEEMFYTAFEHDVVFMNGIYETEEDQQQLEEVLSPLPEQFDNRVYVGLENSSDSQLDTAYGVADYPTVIVVGGNQEAMPQPITEITTDRMVQEICNSFRTLDGAAQQCL